MTVEPTDDEAHDAAHQEAVDAFFNSPTYHMFVPDAESHEIAVQQEAHFRDPFQDPLNREYGPYPAVMLATASKHSDPRHGESCRRCHSWFPSRNALFKHLGKECIA